MTKSGQNADLGRTRSGQNAQLFITNTNIGEPVSILELEDSYGCMWAKNGHVLRITFWGSGQYSLSYRTPNTTLNYRGNINKPLGNQTLKAIMEVSNNKLDFFAVPKGRERIHYCTDTSSNQTGDIIMSIVEGNWIEIKKEGHKPLRISRENLKKITEALC